MEDNQIETFKKQLHRELQFREKTNRMMPEVPELKRAFRDREINKLHRERQASSNTESENFKEMIQNQRVRLNHVSNQKIDVNDTTTHEPTMDDSRQPDQGGTAIRKNSNTVSAELENVFRQIAKKNTPGNNNNNNNNSHNTK